MNVQARLDRLEKNAPAPASADDLSEFATWELFRFNCEHPAAMFRLRQDYPFLQRPVTEQDRQRRKLHPSTQWVSDRVTDHKLVIRGHCARCGYDSFLLDCTNLQQDQWELLGDKFDNENYEWDALVRQLIESGFLDFVPWPPSPELQEQVRVDGPIFTFQIPS